jgi:2-polyprenyl-3-methyl-5-hydroxy-6-metoxy-1,4-benzoquinol methylase
MTKTLARLLAQSPLLARGRRLFGKNSKDWGLLTSRFDKFQAGVYLILQDYSLGLFPPKFEDQAKAYAAEIDYRSHIPGLSLETARQNELKKPFWFPAAAERYLSCFIRLIKMLDRTKLAPPARLLELGCGTGWMSEWLAIAGFDVTATDINPSDINDAQARLRSIQTKGLTVQLRFEIAPMESVAEQVGPVNHYDAVFVFEALHHAFDWRKTLQSSFECLRPGGWLLICNEPNLLHTFVSYRVAKLSNTHEIGFSRRALTRHLTKVGFARVKYMSTPFHFWAKPHWIAAQKSP